VLDRSSNKERAGRKEWRGYGGWFTKVAPGEAPGMCGVCTDVCVERRRAMGNPYLESLRLSFFLFPCVFLLPRRRTLWGRQASHNL
jgi:hypothetical protein